MKNTALPELMRPSDVARSYGVTKARVIQLANEGRLHPIFTPLGRLFDPAEVEQVRREREAGKAHA